MSTDPEDEVDEVVKLRHLVISRMALDASIVDFIDKLLEEVSSQSQVRATTVTDWLLDLRKLSARSYDELHVVIGP